jgi:hypothetical protein
MEAQGIQQIIIYKNPLQAMFWNNFQPGFFLLFLMFGMFFSIILAVAATKFKSTRNHADKAAMIGVLIALVLSFHFGA